MLSTKDKVPSANPDLKLKISRADKKRYAPRVLANERGENIRVGSGF